MSNNRIDNSCSLDCEDVESESLYYKIRQDILFIKSIGQLRKKYPEFIFEYVEGPNDKIPKGFDIKEKVRNKLWVCGKWRSK